MSSNPDETTMFLDEVTTAQKYADELKAQGVDRVILLSHYGYDNDLALAQKTSGIDIIVGGDSHSLLGDLSNLGLNSNGSYPTMVSDASGNDVCVVTAWQYSQVVGELHAEFDGQGMVLRGIFLLRKKELDWFYQEGASHIFPKPGQIL